MNEIQITINEYLIYIILIICSMTDNIYISNRVFIIICLNYLIEVLIILKNFYQQILYVINYYALGRWRL